MLLRLKPIKIFILIIAAILLSSNPVVLAAEVADELESKIIEHQTEIKKLEAEISQYNRALANTTGAATTLKREVDRLNATKQKLSTEIKLTGEKVAAKNLAIEKLGREIKQKQSAVLTNQLAMADILRATNQREDASLIEALLDHDRLTDFWREASALIELSSQIGSHTRVLRAEAINLTQSRQQSELAKADLSQLKQTLVDQKVIATDQQSEKESFLVRVKNQEVEYQRLLNDRRARKEAFEKELFEFESKLKVIIDQSKLPLDRAGVLKWPLDQVFITQQFGRTSDSKRLYLSGTHNGIDLRAAIGTIVKTALGGVVVGVGDTDRVCPKASYGRWVFIKHDNGLSTLYAHLSLISVLENQKVVTGQVIGYTGTTGYSTGPHLHFTVYATEGVNIIQKNSQVCRARYTLPIAAPEAYLDPLLYL